ncbi:MAG: hypothetical protein LBR52_05750 [Prevotellaceae bacterium]|jgi:hypothetical protein|nr:hypothetical protein [Prevotellaceae bacterium]
MLNFLLYNRFENVDDLLKQYVKKNDFWLNRSIKIDQALTPKENLKKVLTDLVEELYENAIMQRILLWALNDTHLVTRFMILAREVENVQLIRYFDANLGNYGVHFNATHAMLISGIYYLILHKSISTFSTVDFSTEENKELMKQNVCDMIDKLFSEPNDVKTMAKKLLNKGVDKNIIAEVTGLSMEELDRLNVE